MEIVIQETPNPNARKFVLPDHRFSGPESFPDVTSAADHPLAARLFSLGGIYNVFWVRDFVTINKFPDVLWEPLDAQVVAVLQAYLVGK